MQLGKYMTKFAIGTLQASTDVVIGLHDDAAADYNLPEDFPIMSGERSSMADIENVEVRATGDNTGTGGPLQVTYPADNSDPIRWQVRNGSGAVPSGAVTIWVQYHHSVHR